MRFSKVSFLSVLAGLLLLAGCSTTNHAPLPTMIYHDLTSHYNAYFNTHEKLKGVYATLDKTHKDNYKDIISLYTYGNPKETSAVSADLEDIEKRETYSVQVHKVSNWADDHFVQMGIANYIKGNYDRAASFFKYSTTEYKNGVDYVKEMKKMGKIAKPTMKKKPAKKPKFEQKLDDKGNLVLQKVDERPSYNFLVHSPARSEALIWLARTYSAQKKYTEASAVIQFMRSDDKFYRNWDRFVETAEAENMMNQKDYRDAIKPLEKFLTMTKKKSERVRPLFILAQIYERENDFAKASGYYKEVLSNKPTAEMEFYAKIRRAKLGNKSGNNDDVKKLLIAMSHDGKFKDYLDQVYYEMGMIMLAQNNRVEARKDFRKSIASSTRNSDQKALSYLTLGKMDFEEEYYVSAKFFYDSTVQNMSKADTSFDAILARDKTLDKLVKQIDIIYTEDSLQRIANMSSADRNRFLKKLVAQQEREAEEKQSAKAAGTDFIKPAGGTGNLSVPGSDEATTFYFYNVASRSNGYSDFIKKWGNRKLEDNWRRKDKSATISENSSEDSDSAKLKAAAKDSLEVPGGAEQKLLAGLPMTPEKMEKSNKKLVEAYYALGTVYKDDLGANHKAIAAFEELNRRFPKNKLELESFYQLYLLYERTKNSNKSEFYKQAIIDKYPSSTIAKYLKDPAYLAELKKKENSISTYYEEAFSDYSSGLYVSAEKKCSEVDAQFKENKLRAKFDLLNAMILAKENRLGDYVESLNKIISKYPGTPEKDQAQGWLNILNHSKLPQVDISKLPKDSLGSIIPPPPGAVYGFTNMDTVGRAAFLEKMEVAKKEQAKADQQAALVKTLAAARASAEAAKTAPADTGGKATAAIAKPYKPLSRVERLDSIMKAERNKSTQTASVSPKASAADNSAAISSPTSPTVSSSPNPAVHPTDTVAVGLLKPSTKAPAVKTGAKPNAKDSASKKMPIQPLVKKDTAAVKSAQGKVSKPVFDADTLADVFGKSDGAPHYVIVYFLDPAAYDYSVNTRIDNFNASNFAGDKLNARSVVLDKDDKLIVVKSFRNKDLAMAYLTSLNSKIDEVMGKLEAGQYFIGAISQINYPTLIDSKKINNYMRFYRNNYK